MAETQDGLNIQYNIEDKTIIIRDRKNSIAFKGANTHETLNAYSTIESICGKGPTTFETIGRIIRKSNLEKQ